jgi:hypothetical protein
LLSLVLVFFVQTEAIAAHQASDVGALIRSSAGAGDVGGKIAIDGR